MLLASYLVNKPSGQPLVYLIIAAVLFVLAAIAAARVRQLTLLDIYRALIATGLALVVIALLTH